MKRRIFLLVLGLLLSVTGTWASMPKLWPFETVTVNGITIHVVFLDDGIIHVQKCPEELYPKSTSRSISVPGADPWVWKHFSDSIIDIATSTLSVTIDKRTGCLTFGNSTEGILLQETAMTLKDGVTQRWAINPNEEIFELGLLQQDSTLSVRERSLTARHPHDCISVPCYASERGYGLYWDHNCQLVKGTESISLSSETGNVIDYYFVYDNGTMDGAIRYLRHLTRHTVVFPQSTLDHWRSEGWKIPGKPTKWYNFHTNRLYDGSQQEAGSSQVPVFVRAGSIFAFGPEGQGADETSMDNVEIRIYPGADGEFRLVEDDGTNYFDAKGHSSIITFYWDDAARQLFIAGRTGKFKGMLKKRQFRITLVGETERVVAYKGKKLTVKF